MEFQKLLQHECCQFCNLHKVTQGKREQRKIKEKGIINGLNCTSERKYKRKYKALIKVKLENWIIFAKIQMFLLFFLTSTVSDTHMHTHEKVSFEIYI